MPSKIVEILATLANSDSPKNATSLFMLEEVFVALLAIASMVIFTLVFAIGLILFSDGARFGFLWLQAKIARSIRMKPHSGPTTG